MTTATEDRQTGGRQAIRTPPVVSREEWEQARARLLVKEKQLTRARDALAAERRRMRGWPWRRAMPLRAWRDRSACSTCSTAGAS
jgi:hypothetical protein